MTGSPAKPFRHFSFFHLWDALSPDLQECPICFLRRKGLEKQLDDYFYEKVSDPGMNASLVQSLGFSFEAMKYAMQKPDPLGMSLTYNLIACSISDRLKKGDWELKPSSPCPILKQANQSEHSYLQEMRLHFFESDFRDRYQASFGLCLHHLRVVLALMTDSSDRKWLMTQEETKITVLGAELAKFARKTSYLNTEPFGPEKDAWQRAGRKFFQSPERPGLPWSLKTKSSFFRRILLKLKKLFSSVAFS